MIKERLIQVSRSPARYREQTRYIMEQYVELIPPPVACNDTFEEIKFKVIGSLGLIPQHAQGILAKVSYAPESRVRQFSIYAPEIRAGHFPIVIPREAGRDRVTNVIAAAPAVLESSMMFPFDPLLVHPATVFFQYLTSYGIPSAAVTEFQLHGMMGQRGSVSFSALDKPIPK